MGITRRTSLFSILGGLFAPAVAEGAHSSTVTNPNIPLGWKNSVDTVATEDPVARFARMESRKKELQKIISGDLTEWQERRLKDEIYGNTDLDSYKSISQSGRRFIESTRRQERMKENFIEEAKNELAHLEKYWENLVTGKDTNYVGADAKANYEHRAGR